MGGHLSSGPAHLSRLDSSVLSAQNVLSLHYFHRGNVYRAAFDNTDYYLPASVIYGAVRLHMWPERL